MRRRRYQSFDGGRTVTARAVSLAVDLVLNGAAAHCAGRYSAARAGDPSVLPEMEAVQQAQPPFPSLSLHRLLSTTTACRDSRRRS